jgi:WD40 repeat protein
LLSHIAEKLHSYSYLTNWEKYDIFLEHGLGFIQNHQKWMCLTRCLSEPSERNKGGQRGRGSLAPDSFASPSIPNEPLTRRPRYDTLEFVETRCTVDGRDPNQWQRVCIKPAFELTHERHSLLASSPDGRYLASASNNGSVKVFDSLTGAEFYNISIKGRVTCMSFQLDKDETEFLLMGISGGAYEQRLVRWSLLTGSANKTLSGKKLGINSPLVACGFVRDESTRLHSRAFGLTTNGTLMFWDLENETILKTFTPEKDDAEIFHCGAATVSSDGRFVVVGIRHIKLIQCPNFNVVWMLRVHPKANAELRSHSITHLEFARNGFSLFVVTQPKKTLQSSNEETKTDELAESPLPKPSLVDWRGVVQRLDLHSRMLHIMALIEDSVSCLAVSFDSSLIALGGSSGLIQILHAGTGQRKSVEPLSHQIQSAVFLPEPSDNVGSDNSNIPSKAYLKRKTSWCGTVEPESGYVFTDFSEDSKTGPQNYRLASGTLNGVIRVLGLQREMERNLRTPITTAHCTKDGKYLILVGGGDVVDINSLSEKPEKPAPIDKTNVVYTARQYEERAENLEDIIVRARRDSTADDAALVHSTQTQPKSALVIPAMNNLKTSSFSQSSLADLKSAVSEIRLAQQQNSGDSQDSLGAPRKAAPTTQSSPVSIWEIETGRRIGLIDVNGEVIWCDVEYAESGKIETIVTGERNGSVKIWKFNAFGEYDAIFKPPITNKHAPVEMMEFNVIEEGDPSVILGYALNQHNHVLAVSILKPSEPLDDVDDQEEDVPPFTTGVELWSLDSAQRLDYSDIELQSLPRLIGLHHAKLSLPLTWGSPSRNLLHFIECPTPLTDLPCALVVGVERFNVYPDVPVTASTAVLDTIDAYAGPDALKRCTASCQSSFDSKVIIVAIEDTIYWISEELFPIIVMPAPRGSVAARYDSHTEIDIHSNEISASESSLDLHHQEDIERTSEFCHVRTIQGKSGECIIGVHHMKTPTADALIAVSDVGTVTLYDLSIPDHKRRDWAHKQEVDYEAKVLGMWHARTPVHGMQVVNVDSVGSAPEKLGEGSGGGGNSGVGSGQKQEKSKWIVVLWGPNGFATVLNIKL